LQQSFVGLFHCKTNKQTEKALLLFKSSQFSSKLYYLPRNKFTFQGCGLRKITRIPKVPNHEILGAQHLGLYEKVSFSSHPKAKVSPLWHWGASRAQPCF